jgi:hypothetical protein
VSPLSAISTGSNHTGEEQKFGLEEEGTGSDSGIEL